MVDLKQENGGNMKRILLVMICVVLCSLLLAAGSENLVIIGFGAADRDSRNVADNINKRQLEPVFGSGDHFRLIPSKNVDNAKKELKITKTADAFDSADATRIGEKLDASIVVWGQVQSISGNQTTLRMSGTMLSQRSGTVSTFNFQIPKDNRQRETVLKNELLTKLTDFSKGEVQKLFDMALQQYNSKLYDTAEAGFLNIIRIDNANMDAYKYLGYIQYEQENYEGAANYYNQGLAIDPNHEDLLRYLSMAYTQQGKTDEAIGTLEKVAEINADKAVYYQVARLYRDRGDTADALAALDNALAIDPELDAAHDLYADITYSNEDYNKAIEHLEYMTNIRPDDDNLARKLAFSYSKTGQLDKAIERYTNMIKSDPNNVRAYLNLAAAYRTMAINNPREARQNNTQALQTYQNAMKVDPNNARIEVSLANVYLDLDDRTNADKWANSARQKDPTIYEASQILGEIAQKNGIDRYRRYTDLQKQSANESGTLYGKALDDIIAQRDQTKKEANTLFNRADTLFRDALNNAPDNAKNDINAKIRTNREYIELTKPDFF